MTDFEQQLLARIERLEIEVERLISIGKKPNSLTPAEIAYFEALPNNAVVRKSYVSYRFNCSENDVMRGRGGTAPLKEKRISDKPLKWIKADVDALFREFIKTPRERAAEALNKIQPRRKRSILKK